MAGSVRAPTHLFCHCCAAILCEDDSPLVRPNSPRPRTPGSHVPRLNPGRDRAEHARARSGGQGGWELSSCETWMRNCRCSGLKGAARRQTPPQHRAAGQAPSCWAANRRRPASRLIYGGWVRKGPRDHHLVQRPGGPLRGSQGLQMPTGAQRQQFGLQIPWLGESCPGHEFEGDEHPAGGVELRDALQPLSGSA